MKGIAHFASGLCVATFVPGVVERAMDGSLLIALGGACAMLPDFLDFRFAKFLERRDADIAPDPQQPSAQSLADAIANEMRAVTPQRSRVVQLHPARRGVIDWVLYVIRFESVQGDVVVALNDQAAHSHVGKIDYTYDGDLEVGELGGPSLKFSQTDKGVRVEFLPWHRVWSHSLVLALFASVVFGLLIEPLAGVVAGLGYAIHVIEDQLGFLGSNLFWPLTKNRSDGLKLLHSGDTIPNMLTVWLSLAFILLNLDRARTVPLLDLTGFLFFAVILPTIVLLVIYARKRIKNTNVNATERERDALAETEEAQIQ